MQVAISNSGNLQDHFSIIGDLYYDMDISRSLACTLLPRAPTSQNDFNTQSNPPILLVRPEVCSFGVKARNAQNAGYHGIIIVHSSSERDIDNIALQDYSTDNDIHIPILVLSNADGTILQHYLIDRTKRNANADISQALILNIQIDNAPLDNLDLKFFYSSDDVSFYNFFQDYYPLIESLNPYLNFTFHVVTHPNQDSSQINTNCVSQGKHCSPLVKNKRIKGKDIVLMDLFHQCVFSLYGFESFISYLKTFYFHCYWNVPKFTKECVKDVLTINQLLYNKVENCVASSFGSQVLTEQTVNNKDNSLLTTEYQIKKKYDAKSHPIVYINNQLLDKPLTINNFVDSICRKLNKRPDYCKVYYSTFKSHDTFGMGFMFLLIFVVIVINIAIYIICRKYLLTKIKERLDSDSIDIDGRINNAVSKYFSMKETSVEMK
jgi:hypothetical protein